MGKIKRKIVLFAALFTLAIAPSAHAVALYDWAFNVDGTVYQYGDALPGTFDDSGFDWGTGLGTLTIDVTGAGSHNVISYFDHEIDELENTYYNEYGSTGGVLEAGQSWEIDEPGWYFGDIYDNVLNGALDNFNNVPSGWEDDVSMAMGWDFTLAAGESAVISLFLSDTVVPAGFYLEHNDPDSNESIYMSSSLDINITGDGPVAVPEPATILLLGSGLFGLACFRKKFIKKV